MKRSNSNDYVGNSPKRARLLGEDTDQESSDSEDENPAQDGPAMMQFVQQANNPLLLPAQGVGLMPATQPTGQDHGRVPAAHEQLTEPVLMVSGGKQKADEDSVRAGAASSSSASSASAAIVNAVAAVPRAPHELWRALVNAIDEDDLALVTRLVESGSPLKNPLDDDNYTPDGNALLAAIAKGKLPAVEILLSHPAIGDEKANYLYQLEAARSDCDGSTPLLTAAGFATEDPGKFPVKSSAIADYLDTQCWDECDIEFFDRIFAAGANPNCLNELGTESASRMLDRWSDDLDGEAADEYITMAATFKTAGMIINEPDAMKEAIDEQDFGRLERQVRHDLRSAKKRQDEKWMQTADTLDRLELPAVAADLLRFPECSRTRSGWQAPPLSLSLIPSVFTMPTAGDDWRNKLLSVGFARPLIDFLEKKLGKKLQLLAFLAPPAPVSSSSSSVVHAHPVTPAQAWLCLKSCADELGNASLAESLASAYRAKGLSVETEDRLVSRLSSQIESVVTYVTFNSGQAEQGIQQTIGSLVELCWQHCPPSAGGAGVTKLSTALHHAGLFGLLASRVVDAWQAVLQSLASTPFIPPVLSDAVGLLDTPQGEKIAHQFGDALLANLDSVANAPFRLPADPDIDPALFMNVMTAQFELLTSYARGAVEFTRSD